MNSHYVDNKYQRWYSRLMDAARDRVLIGDIERHHVLPRSLGGQDGDVVRLTYREHFVAHWLLTKFTVGKAKRKMCYALWSMVRVSPGRRRVVTARQYEIAKRAQRAAVSGKEISDATRARMKAAKSNPSGKTREKLSVAARNRSAEWRAKISAANRSRITTDSARQSMSAAQSRRSSRPEHSAKMMGHAVSDATRQKMSDAATRNWALRRGEKAPT